MVLPLDWKLACVTLGNHCPEWVWSLRMRLPFCILSVVGDVLDDGELHFIASAQTLEAATRRVKALAGLCPGQYVIYDEQTGERLSIIAGTKPRTLPLKATFGKNTRSTI